MNKYRLVFLSVLGLFFITLLPSIVSHYVWLMGGEGLVYIIKNRWDIAALNIIFFIIFLALIPYKKKTGWRSRNIYSAFIIALFAEMYGFPLTAYFMVNYFGAIPVNYKPAYVFSFNLLGVEFTMPTMMIVGATITTIGLIVIILGWYKIHKSGGCMVTTGVYRFSRHPQYVGILLITFGWLIHWPTFLTLIMWPILALNYYRLAKEEERSLKEKFPAEFKKYKEETPMFI